MNNRHTKPFIADILIVDDRKTNLDLLSKLLAGHGYYVRAALNGNLALTAAKKACPDLILLDIVMPGMSGYEVCERLKADDATRDIPVIFMSAKNEILDRVKAFSLGAVDYITKPFQVEEVLARINTHVTLRKVQQQLQAQNVQLQQEIAEHKQTLEFLHELKKAIETTEVGVTVTDRQRRIIYVNPSEAKMHGYTEEELIGQPSNIFTTPEYRQDTQGIERELEKYLNWKRESLNVRKDGGTFPVELISNPLYDEQGILTGFVTICTDITERTQVRNELLQAKQTAEEARREAEKAHQEALDAKHAAEAANRAKSAFLAHMSHELRTPLNAILGFSQLLAYGQNLTADQRENLRTINQSGEHLLTLINQVLNLSKIEAGHITVQEQNIDLHQLLADVTDMSRNRAEKRGLQLCLDRPDELPRYVRTDEVKLRQILINLLSNAIKFTRQGGITLCAKVVREPDVHLIVDIEDTGPGIPPDELPYVFDAFTQTSTGQASQEGTGLGLAISQKFAEVMNGEITVSSEVGKGTIFTVRLPIAIVEAADVQPPRATRRVIGVVPGQPRYRILVVDDEVHNRQLVFKLLQPLGFELREAANGQEALKIWKEWTPHLIWMDMRMPGMNGYEATQKIRGAEGSWQSAVGSRQSAEGSWQLAVDSRQPAAGSTQHPAPSTQHPAPSTQHPASSIQHPVPSTQYPAPSTQHPAPSTQHPVIIALTASIFEEERAGILSTGCDDILHKPFREAEMFDLLYRHLGVRFVYEEQEPCDGERSGPSDVTLPAALAALAPELLKDLKYAADTVNMKQVKALIDQIRPEHPALAEALTALADQFDYPLIARYVEEIM